MRVRFWVVAAVLLLACAGLAAAALIAWPQARLVGTDDALARVELPAFAGHVTSVAVHSSDGAAVPVRLRGANVWPRHTVGSGVRLTVAVTVTRPGWASWLVGKTERRSFTIVTPRARLLGRWLQVKSGAPVTISFDAPVGVVALGGASARRLVRPRAAVPVGVVARGSGSAGTIEVAAAARSWEQLPAPVRVSWFPARPYPQLLAEPRPGTRLPPARQLTLTFSSPVRDALGARRPRLSPVTPGRWRQPDAHTLYSTDARAAPGTTRIAGREQAAHGQPRPPEGHLVRLARSFDSAAC